MTQTFLALRVRAPWAWCLGVCISLICQSLMLIPCRVENGWPRIPSVITLEGIQLGPLAGTAPPVLSCVTRAGTEVTGMGPDVLPLSSSEPEHWVTQQRRPRLGWNSAQHLVYTCKSVPLTLLHLFPPSPPLWQPSVCSLSLHLSLLCSLICFAFFFRVHI